MTSHIVGSIEDAFALRPPPDQMALQKRLEQTLCTYCDGLTGDQIGMHWSFDWLFRSKEAFALAVGRFFEADQSYTHLSFRRQTNRVGGTKGEGFVYELRLPAEVYRFSPAAGEISVSYRGEVEYQVRTIGEPAAVGDAGRSAPAHGWVDATFHKKLTQPGRPWTSHGEVILREAEAGANICRWSWQYTTETVVDRPDYSTEALLWALEKGLLPIKFGHFVPAMRAELAASSRIVYQLGDEPEVARVPQGAYYDGNYGRAGEHQQIVTERWAWMAAPQLWTTDGAPAPHMLTLGFFRSGPGTALMLGNSWSGGMLWRSSPFDMTQFSLRTPLDQFDVRFHSPKYLDVTVVTNDRRHRITIRAWSETLTTPLTMPSGREFHDHEDLLADAYVVIEHNAVDGPQRFLRTPKWELEARLVTNMFGYEYGEQSRVVGAPGYPAYEAVPQMPAWFVQALGRIPDELGHPTAAVRLSAINDG